MGGTLFNTQHWTDVAYFSSQHNQIGSGPHQIDAFKGTSFPADAMKTYLAVEIYRDPFLKCILV
jgi:hypothetical protein